MAASAVTAQLPTQLVIGRRALDSLPGVTILKEFEWQERSESWVLNLRLTPTDLVFNEFIPSQTEWFVSLEPIYPFGDINFFPCKQNGIDRTFPHQALNLDAGEDPWRTGKICLSDPYAVFEDRFISSEPYAADERLLWHVKRGLGWLEYASRNQLLKAGNYFELPSFLTTKGAFSLIGFEGSKESFERWKTTTDKSGFFEYYVSPSDKKIILVKQMLRLNRKPLVGSDYGTRIQGFKTPKELGVWLRLDSMPVVPPWQSPLTWGDLEDCFEQQNWDLRASLDDLFSNRKVRDKIASLALIGFPIPNRIGEDPERMHWLGIRLPDLHFRDSAINRFRSSRKSASFANRQALPRSDRVQWIESENWAADQIKSRGSLPENLLKKRTLLIGTGALGSTIAEMLVRGGAYDLTVCDGDKSKIGNLVRHTLDFRHINKNKATALAEHLNELSPWSRVRALPEAFPLRSGFSIDDYDLIIDCTARQEMLSKLASIEARDNICFVSISMSFAAKRLYFFITHKRKFPFDQFRSNIVGWLLKDGDENYDEPAAREGTGCWHPVFPARSDDIWLWGATALKLMVSELESASEKFRVFEQETAMSAGPIKEVFI